MRKDTGKTMYRSAKNIKKEWVFLLFVLLFSAAGCDSGGEETLPVGVSVRPSFFSLPTGGRVQLSADVSGTDNTAVRWSVVSGQGRVDSAGGLFEAPSVLIRNQPATATVQATSQADPTVFSRATINLTQLFPSNGEPVSNPDEIVPGGFVSRQTFDINNDGILDLVTRNAAGATVYLGVGSGGQFVTRPIAGTGGAVAMAVGDFVTDGNIFADVAVARTTGGVSEIAFIQGEEGAPTAATPSVSNTLSLTAAPFSLASGRFHGSPASTQAVSDLAVGVDNGVFIFLQTDRSPGFHFLESPTQIVPVSGKPVQLMTGHFNTDGFLDLGAVLENRADIVVFFGTEQGLFTPVVTAAFQSVPTSAAVGDFNNDLITDLAAGHSTNQVSILLGRGDGTFQTPVSLPTTAIPGAITVIDFNFDRSHDIAVLIPGRGEIFLLLNDGGGHFIGDATLLPVNAQGNRITAPLIDLASGFFSGSFQGGAGAQVAALVYTTAAQFFFLNNPSF